MLIIKKIIFTSLLMLLFNCNTNSTEPQTTAKDPLEDKYAGWQPIKPPGALRSIAGNYEVSRYWELWSYLGYDTGSYFIIRSSEELNEFWNKKLKDMNVLGKALEKPVIDFNKNWFIMTAFGYCHYLVSYNLTVLESDDSIKLHMSTYEPSGRKKLLLSISAAFGFEIPIPPKSKPISVDFDVECQRDFLK